MPYEYVRDNARHRIKISLTDPVTVAELIATVDRQFAEGMWAHGLLVDSRAIRHATPPEDVRLFLARVQALAALHGPRGPVAIVARDAGAVASAQVYAYMGTQTESVIEVFWDVDEAERWLDEQLGRNG